MKFTKSFKVAISLLCVMAMLVSSLLTFTLPTAASSSTSSKDVPTDLTNLTWSDFGMGGVYTSDSSSAQSVEQLDDVLIEGYVTLSGEVDLRVPGIKSNYNWGGIIFGLSGDQLTIDGSVAISGLSAFISPSTVGMTSFAGNEFLLQVSIQYVDNDADGAEDDLKLGIWVNGVMVLDQNSMASDDGYVYVNDHTDYFVKGMMAYPRSGSVTLHDYKAFPDGLTEYGFGKMTNHGAASAVVLGQPITYTGGYYAYNADDASAVNNTIFNADLSIPSATSGVYSRWFDVKGTGGWYGVQMRLDAGGSLVFENGAGITFNTEDNANGWYMLAPAKFGLSTFINTQFNLKMALTDRAEDGTSAKLTVWINDYFAFEVRLVGSAEHPIGSSMVPCAAATGDTALNTYATSKPMPSNVPAFHQLTWGDLGLADGDYGSATGHKFGGYVLAESVNDYASLNETVFNGYATFSGEGDLRWVGYDGWQGLLIVVRSDGYLEVQNSTYGTAYSQLYKPAYFGLEGTTFVGQELNFKISTQIDGDNFTFGVWINDVMAGDYFTLAKGTCTPGSGMGIYDRGSGAVISIRQADKTTFVSDLTEISWSDFGLSDGTTAADGTTYNAASIESMNNTIFNGDVTIPEGVQLRYAGSSQNAWAAMEFRVSSGKLLLCSDTGTFTNAMHDPAKFGLTTFANTKFNLKIALTDMAEDGSTVTVTVWVNNIVVSRSTFTNGAGYTGFTPKLLFHGAGAVVNDASKPITVPEKVEPETLPTDYTYIYASDFGIASGTYEMANSSYVGHTGELNSSIAGISTIDKAILHFEEISFAAGQVHMNFFGPSQDEGFKLLADGGTLTLTSGYGHIIANNGYSSIVFDDTIAGVDVVGGTYDFKISVVYEGTVMKLGVWFENVLYNNEYFLFDTANKGSDNFGNWLAYRSDATGTVVINSKRPTTAPPTGLTELGWYDFEGLENATYPAVAGGLSGCGTYDGSLDGTLLSGEITMGVGTQLRYAGNDGWQGLVISVTADDCLWINSSTFGTAYDEKYPAGTFGLTTFMGTAFNLKISVDIDDSGENYTFGVWVEDTMAGNYFTLAKGAHIAGSMIGLYDNNSGNAITLSGAVQTIPTFPTDYTVYTPASGGIADGAYKLERDDNTYDVNAGAITGITNFDKSALVFEKITFEGCLDMNFFGSTADLGFKWRTNADGTVTLTSGYGELLNETLTDDIAGVDLAGGTYKLAFTLLYTSETTVKLGVWIKDELYNGEYFNVNLDVANDKLGNVLFAAIATYTGDVAAITFGEPLVIETLPDYTVVRPYDFGISDAIYHGSDEDLNFADNGALNTGATSLDEHILAFDSITFTGNTQLSLMGSETLWNSLRFMTTSDGVAYLTSGYGEMLSTFYFDDDIAGVDVVGDTYSLKFSFKFVGDGTMKLGVWFKDVLYNNEYITVTIEGMAQDEIGTYIGIYPMGNGSCVKLQSADWPALPTDLVNTNPSSFGLSENTTYANVEGVYEDSTTLANTSFRANITLHYDGTGEYFICYGGSETGRCYSLRFYFNGDQVQVCAPPLTSIWSGSYDLYASDFGLASFMDTPFEFGVDTVEYNGDVLLYVYVNDKLYNDRPLVINDFAGVMSNALGMHAVFEGAASETNYYKLGAITRDLPDLYHNLVESDYIAADGQTITTPGVTVVTYTDGASNYVQTVITYIPGDTNGDGLVDVADAVQIKLILAGTDFGKLAAKAADYDTDLDNEDEDLTNVRRNILGYEMAEKGEVMPIAGFWGPSRDYGYTDADGTVHYSQYDHITDEMYQLIADMGINEITYSQNVYTNSPTARATVYEMLTHAQNYGINMYVNDTRLNPSTSYTSQELAEYLANYENFQSYAGVFLVDEPAGTSYPASYDADRPISDYGPLATAANNYKRGDVFVYANLLPYWLQMGKQSGIAGWFENEKTAAGRYMTYIREFVEGFDMQYIGYDYYAFDDDNAYLEGDANVQTSEQYFKNMAMVRAVAMEEGLPFRPFVQAGTNWNDTMSEMSATTNNTPTEGEFKWNITTSLAMGAKGIQYFTLMQPEWFALTEGGTYDYNRNGLIGANGEVNTWGEYATEINAHIADVDHVLMAATHEGIMASGGYAESVATAAITDIYSKISTTTSNPVVTSYNEVTGISSSNSTYGALAGCFDYNGKTVLYVSNYDANDSTADTITVSFSSAVNYTVIATTGTSAGNGSSASFSLGAGEGALIVLG